LSTEPADTNERPAPASERPPRPADETRIRYLTPDACRAYLGVHGALHVEVFGERVYGGVYAAYAFPVRHDDRYISLHHVGEGGDVEIGMIRSLGDFPVDQGDLIRDALARRYFIHTILRIRELSWDHGLVRFHVETDKGPVEFLFRYQGDRAVDYGHRGKVLTDVSDNRYVIPDVDQLSPGERKQFLRFIYW
jgi:hypothetical protein